MNLRLEYESVQPEMDYAAFCYTVRDTDSNEVIWRTANRTAAEALVQAVNGSQQAKQEVEALRNQLAHLQANYQRQKERLAVAVKGLRTCANSQCANSGFYTTTACRTIAELGLSINWPKNPRPFQKKISGAGARSAK